MRLLLLAWVFSRVLALCDGTPATVDGYSFQVAYRDPRPWTCCCDEAGEPFPCVIYDLSGWAEGHREPDPGAGDEVSSAWDLPVPPAGAAVLLDVRSVVNGIAYGECP